MDHECTRTTTPLHSPCKHKLNRGVSHYMRRLYDCRGGKNTHAYRYPREKFVTGTGAVF
uniref:Uncharacterized protein n=1 Tax=Medicago truncatula TaxID=3880 RepID=A2Q3V7_MEDTR|nr:hypothetical protein MtrDRAFT_AC155890g30v2 [Medicago truncatula]